MVADGIDTVSTVYVNDKIVGKTNNQFIRYNFDLKPVLKTGKNQIKIAFKAAPTYAKNKAEEFKKRYNYSILPGLFFIKTSSCLILNMIIFYIKNVKNKVYHGECHWNFIRKMASSFSWDWVTFHQICEYLAFIRSTYLHDIDRDRHFQHKAFGNQ